MHSDTILLKICKCKISTQKFFLFFLQLTEVSRQGKLKINTSNDYLGTFCRLILTFTLSLIIYCFLHDCGKEMLLPSILKKKPNKTIEIHVVDERDLKYILTPMACFVTNYNNSCMFNLYSLSAIKNHDTPLMVFEKKITKLHITSLTNSNT